jgi:predicted nucleic acid-binding Zn ribbon protein
MTNEQSLKEVLNELIDSLHVGDKINELQISESWEKIMGKLIARHTVSLFLKNKTLYITLNSAALRQELSYAKAKMIKMLNKELGSKLIEDIVIR